MNGFVDRKNWVVCGRGGRGRVTNYVNERVFRIPE